MLRDLVADSQEVQMGEAGPADLEHVRARALDLVPHAIAVDRCVWHVSSSFACVSVIG